MSGGWQVGDLALCVNDRATHPIYGNGGLKRGRTYTVQAVPDFGPGLFLCEISDGNAMGYNRRRFIKVTPPEADEFDREVIEHMLGKPVLEPSA